MNRRRNAAQLKISLRRQVKICQVALTDGVVKGLTPSTILMTHGAFLKRQAITK